MKKTQLTTIIKEEIKAYSKALKEVEPQTPNDVKFAAKAQGNAKSVGTANKRIDTQSEFAGAFETWFSSLGYKPGKITKSLVRREIETVLSKLGFN
jgi:hypothetical protein